MTNGYLKDILYIILSAAIGAISSWIISRYYFNKESRAEKIADQIKEALQKSLLPLIYPQFYDPNNVLTVYPQQPAPKNTDIPSVEYAIFARKIFRPNEKVDVIIKLKDTGFDLDNPGGVRIRDHRDNELGVVPIGLGYVRASYFIAIDEHAGAHKLTVVLEDLGVHVRTSNKNTQTLLFVIEKENTA